MSCIFPRNNSALKIVALMGKPNVSGPRRFSNKKKDTKDEAPKIHPGAPKIIDRETHYFKKEEREKLEALKKKQKKEQQSDLNDKNKDH